MSDPTAPAITSGWRIDKTVNLPFMLTLIVSIAGVVFGYSNLVNRLLMVERSVSQYQSDNRDVSDLKAQMSVMVERTSNSKASLDRIQAQLDQMAGRPYRAPAAVDATP